MKPPTPTPTSSSASRTLTAAMIPSSRFVVPSSLPIVSAPSERRVLVRRRVPPWRLFGDRVGHLVEHAPAVVGDAGGLANGRPEAGELAREVVDRRLELPPKDPSVRGEEEVADQSAERRAGAGRRHRSREI